jgi:hypothetical protein
LAEWAMSKLAKPSKFERADWINCWIAVCCSNFNIGIANKLAYAVTLPPAATLYAPTTPNGLQHLQKRYIQNGLVGFRLLK